MKVFQVEERYAAAVSFYDADYLLAAESESEAREAAEKKLGTRKPWLFNGDVVLTVVEIFDQQRIDGLEERLSLLEQKRETKK